jgi:hypothetical protein
MIVYFGLWCEGSSYIDSCQFVTTDYDECVKFSTDLLTGFITCGPDDNQRVTIRGVELNTKQFKELLDCVDNYNSDILWKYYEMSTGILEYNYSDRDEYSEDDYDDPDFETNVRFYVEQDVIIYLNSFDSK